MPINQFEIDALLNSVKINTYVCDVCGKAIIPDVHLKFDDTIDVIVESADIRCAYNKRLKKVCRDCATAMSLQSVEPVYKFGDILSFISPQNNSKTQCLFIRKEGNKAVVMFENAEFAARVKLDSLER